MKWILSIVMAAPLMGMVPKDMTVQEKISLLDTFRRGEWDVRDKTVRFANNFADFENIDSFYFDRTLGEIGNYFRELLRSTPDPEASEAAKKAFKRQSFVQKVCTNKINELTLEDDEKILRHAVAWELLGKHSKASVKELVPTFLEACHEDDSFLVTTIVGLWRASRGDHLSKAYLFLKYDPVLPPPDDWMNHVGEG